MKPDFWKRVNEAVEFWKNQDSDMLLTLMIDYAKDNARYSCGSYDIARAEECDINVIAIRKILRERLEVK